MQNYALINYLKDCYINQNNTASCSLTDRNANSKAKNEILDILFDASLRIMDVNAVKDLISKSFIEAQTLESSFLKCYISALLEQNKNLQNELTVKALQSEDRAEILAAKNNEIEDELFCLRACY